MIKVRAKSFIYTRQTVRQVDRAMVTPLFKAAAYVRMTARRSIRKTKKKASAPGSAPNTRGGKFSLRKSIGFNIDRRNLSAVAGPDYMDAGTVGHLHEFGGSRRRRTATWKIKRGGHGPIAYRGKLIILRLNSRAQVERSKEVAANYYNHVAGRGPAQYPARPFMGPALTKSLSQLPRLWRGAIKN